MPMVTVTLEGPDKENVAYVRLGDKRWGDNGEDYDTPQAVAAGAQAWTVRFPRTEAGNTLDVPAQAAAVLTVYAGDNDVTVTIA